MTPLTIGRIVHYRLNEGDCHAINKRRDDFTAYQRSLVFSDEVATPGSTGATGHVGHTGNHVLAGDIYPAVVVRVWDPDIGCNLHVLLDGNDSYWATSRHEGTEAGQWSWPVKE